MPKLFTLVVSIATILIATGCSHTTPPQPSANTSPTPTTRDHAHAEADIREAAYRELLKDIPRDELSCLSFGETADGNWIDPPDDFIARFADTGLTIGKPSQAKLIHPRPGSVRYVNPATGKAAYVYFVHFQKWLAEDRVEVEIGRYGGSLDAYGQTGVMSKRDGRWSFQSSGRSWVS